MQMTIKEDYGKTIFHELGHLCIAIISNSKIISLKLSEKSHYINQQKITTVGGCLDSNDNIKNSEIYLIENINGFCFRIFNYFTGSIFENLYLNGSLENAKFLFKRGRGINGSDFEIYIRSINEYKNQHLLDIENKTFIYFNELNNLFYENQNLRNYLKEIIVDIESNLEKDKFKESHLNIDFLNHVSEKTKLFLFQEGLTLKIQNLKTNMVKDVSSPNG
jgi:hypothetical protein